MDGQAVLFLLQLTKPGGERKFAWSRDLSRTVLKESPHNRRGRSGVSGEDQHAWAVRWGGGSLPLSLGLFSRLCLIQASLSGEN